MKSIIQKRLEAEEIKVADLKSELAVKNARLRRLEDDLARTRTINIPNEIIPVISHEIETQTEPQNHRILCDKSVMTCEELTRFNQEVAVNLTQPKFCENQSASLVKSNNTIKCLVTTMNLEVKVNSKSKEKITALGDQINHKSDASNNAILNLAADDQNDNNSFLKQIKELKDEINNKNNEISELNVQLANNKRHLLNSLQVNSLDTDINDKYIRIKGILEKERNKYSLLESVKNNLEEKIKNLNIQQLKSSKYENGLKIEIDAQQNEISQLNAIIKKLELELSQLKRNIEESDEKYRQLAKEATRIKCEKTELEFNFNEIKQKLSIEKLSSNSDRLNLRLAEGEIEELKRKLANAQTRYDNAVSSSTKRLSELSEVHKTEINTLESTKKGLQYENEELKTKVTLKSDKLVAVEKTKKSLYDELDKTQALLSDFERIKRSEQRLKMKVTELQKVQQSNKTENCSKDIAISDHEETIKKLNDEIYQLNEEIAQYAKLPSREQFCELKDELEELTKENERLVDAKSMLIVNQNNDKEIQEKLESEISMLNDELRSHKQIISMKEEQLKELKYNLDDQVTQLKNEQDKTSKLKVQITNLTEEIQDLKSDLKRIKTDIIIVTSERDSLNIDNKQKSSVITKLKMDKSELNKKVSAIENANVQLKDNNEDLTKKLENMKIQLNNADAGTRRYSTIF